jgi:methionyl-tRNA formyltransferase
MCHEPKPFRLMFLGDRRIASEILRELMVGEFRAGFDVKVVVTSERIERWIRKIAPSRAVYLRNDQRHLETINRLIDDQGIDLILSIQHNWILPRLTLDKVSGRAFNLHNAKLPDYKGYNSISHALMNGDSLFHPTLHWMVEEVDSGPIAYQGLVKVEPFDTAYSLYPRTVIESVRIVRLLLSSLMAGRDIPASPMANGKGEFYRRTDLNNLADVSAISDPIELDRRVRAVFFPPFNAAYLEKNGRRTYLVPEAEFRTHWRQSRPLNELSDECYGTD